MQPENEFRVPQGRDWAKTAAVAISLFSLVVSLGSLSVAYWSYSLNKTNADAANGRIDRLGKIYLHAHVNGDSLEVASADSDKHILNLLVQYPSGAFTHGVNGMVGSMGDGLIRFDDEISKYMINRFKVHAGFDTLPLGFNETAFVPVIIYTTYTYDGKQQLDRSVYLMSYLVFSPMREVVTARPLAVVFCGRMSKDEPTLDFLADPWLSVPVGKTDQKSMAALVLNCAPPSAQSDHLPDSRTMLQWFFLSPGSFKIVSDLAENHRDPKEAPHWYSVSSQSVYIKNLGGEAVEVRYAYSFPED